MTKPHQSLKKVNVKTYTTLSNLFLNKLKSPKFFSIGLLMAVDIDASVLLIVILMVAIITFLVGIAYGIYLNDKISNKRPNNQLIGS